MKKIKNLISRILAAIVSLVTIVLQLFIAIPKDKLLHLIAGTYGYILFANFTSNYIALVVIVLIGAAKELVWDKWMGKGTPEFLDFLLVLIGALITFNLF